MARISSPFNRTFLQRTFDWWSDRLTFIVLLSWYPLISTIYLLSDVIENNYIFFTIMFSITQIVLASDASERLRRRLRLARGKDKFIRSERFRGGLEILSALSVIAAAQHIFRTLLTIESDPTSLHAIGYNPAEDAFFYVSLLGALWVILIAYIGKYRWDDYIMRLEHKALQKRRARRQIRRKT